jgi:hypothetical protein
MGSSDEVALPLIALPGVRHSKSQAIGFSSASRTTPQLPVRDGEKDANPRQTKRRDKSRLPIFGSLIGSFKSGLAAIC